MQLQDGNTLLTLFLLFLLLAAAALVIAWHYGRRWGDLSSRRQYGEALTEDEQTALRRARRNFWIWAGISLVLMALSFFALA